jgi:hypothetical protein
MDTGNYNGSYQRDSWGQERRVVRSEHPVMPSPQESASPGQQSNGSLYYNDQSGANQQPYGPPADNQYPQGSTVPSQGNPPQMPGQPQNQTFAQQAPPGPPQQPPSAQPQQPGGGRDWQERWTTDGSVLEGKNQVRLDGCIAYQRLDYPGSSGTPRCKARLYIPVTDRNGQRKFIGYPIHAWGQLAEAMASIPPGTPIKVFGALNIFSWRDRATNEPRSVVDVKVIEYEPV